jgi:hypothetical protein
VRVQQFHIVIDVFRYSPPSHDFFSKGEYILKGLNSGIKNTPWHFLKSTLKDKQNTAKYMQSSRKQAEIRAPTPTASLRASPSSPSRRRAKHWIWICRNSHRLPHTAR